MNNPELEQAVLGLKQRLGALEIQYSSFVKYCIEMIKCHRNTIESELRSDPNTPRDLLSHINLHGEELENKVKQASVHINREKSSTGLDSFKYGVIFLLNNQSESNKYEKLNSLFSELELHISLNYSKKESLASDSSLLQQKDSEIKHLAEENLKIKNFNKFIKAKIEDLKQKNLEKEQKIKELESLQKNSEFKSRPVSKTINTRCTSINTPKNLSPVPKVFESFSGSGLIFTSQSSEDETANILRYSSIHEKLLSLLDTIQKFTEKTFSFSVQLTQNPEVSNWMKNIKLGTEEIGKVIEDIVTPRFKEEVSDKAKEPNSLACQLMAKAGDLAIEVKTKDLKISSLSSQVKELKKQISEKTGKISEMGSKKGELKIRQKNRQKAGLKIENTGYLSVVNLYKNENLIKELRKILKNKEKEWASKELKFESKEKETQTDFEELDFQTRKQKFTNEDVFRLNKKISNLLIEKNEIEEKFGERQNSVFQLKDFIKSQQIQISSLQSQITDLEAREINKNPGQNLQIFRGLQTIIYPCPTSLVQDLESLKSENQNLFIKVQNLEISLKDSEIQSNFLNEKQKILEKESQKLSKVLFNYEEASSTQELQIKSLVNEKELLESELQNNKKKFESKLLEKSKFFQCSLKKLQRVLNSLPEIEEIFFKFLSKTNNTLSGHFQLLSKQLKSLQSLSTAQKLTRQSLSSTIESLKSRVQDQENSIFLLNNSLKLAESTVLSYSSLEQDKQNLAAERDKLLEQVASLTEQLSKLTSSQTAGPESLAGHIENFAEIFKNSERVKGELCIVLKNKEDLIRSLQQQNFESEAKIKTQSFQLEVFESEIAQLKSAVSLLNSKNTDDEIEQIKTLYQSQLQIQDREIQRLEMSLKCLKENGDNEKKILSGNVDKLGRELETAYLKINSLTEQNELKDLWKEGSFKVIRCVKYKNTTWHLIETPKEQIWTNQEIMSNSKDDFQELTEKYEKIKYYSYRLREEYKKLKIRFEKLKQSKSPDLSSMFVSPRDLEIQLICEGLISARSKGTDYDVDELSELNSRIINEGFSIFNASSFEEPEKTQNEAQVKLEQLSLEIRNKNEIIRNYEKIISDMRPN